MGLKKNYDDLTRNPEFTNGLQVSTGQAIEDGAGTNRFEVNTNQTRMKDEDGIKGFETSSSNRQVNLPTDTPFVLVDGEQSATAVQYDTDTDAGVLRTPNAGIRIESRPKNFKEGLTMWQESDNEEANFDLRDSTDSTINKLALKNGITDMSEPPVDLRLATGQAIEDGSGTARFSISNSNSAIYDSAGRKAIEFYGDGNPAGNYFIRAKQTGELKIYDDEGSFPAVTYTTDASQGTLELTNANLDLNGNNITSSLDVSGTISTGDRGLDAFEDAGFPAPNVGGVIASVDATTNGSQAYTAKFRVSLYTSSDYAYYEILAIKTVGSGDTPFFRTIVQEGNTSNIGTVSMNYNSSTDRIEVVTDGNGIDTFLRGSVELVTDRLSYNKELTNET